MSVAPNLLSPMMRSLAYFVQATYHRLVIAFSDMFVLWLNRIRKAARKRIFEITYQKTENSRTATVR